MFEHPIALIPTAMFAVAAAAAAGDFLRERRFARWFAVAAVTAGIVARIATFMEPGLCPVNVAGGGLGIVALVLALHVLVTSLASARSAARTVALLAMVFVLDLLAQVFAKRDVPFHPPARERALGELHGGVVLLAYAAFLVAAVYAVLYLVLYSRMKSRRLGFWFQRLPPLKELENRASSAEGLGLALLTLGLMLGFYSFWVFRGGVPYDDAKFVVASLLWLWFAGGMALRRIKRWSGVRPMLLPALGAVLIVLVYSVAGGHPFWSTR